MIAGPSRSLAARGFAEVLSLALSALAGIWISRAIGPASFGLYALVWALAQAGTLVVGLGTTMAGSQRVANRPEASTETWAAILAARLTAATAVGILATILLAIVPLQPGLRSMLAFGILAVVAAAFRAEWIFLGLGRPLALAGLRVSSSAAALVVAILLVRGPADAGVATASIAAQAVVLAGAGSLLALRVVGPPRRGLSPAIVTREGLVYARNELAVFTYTNSDRLFLFVFASPMALGLYDAAYRLIQPLYAISAVVGDTMYAPLARAFGTPDLRRVFGRYVDLMSFVAIPFGPFCTVASGWIVALIYGPAFSSSAPLLAMLGWVITLGYVAGIAIIPMGAWNRPREFASGTEIGGITDLVLNVALIPPLGGLGAALATLGANAATVVAGLRNLRRVTDYPLVRHLAVYLGASAGAMVAYLVGAIAGGPIGGTAAFAATYLLLARVALQAHRPTQ